jgi:hypothetical protein
MDAGMDADRVPSVNPDAADPPGVPTEAAQGRALVTGLVIGVIFGGIVGGIVGAVVSGSEARTEPAAMQPAPRVLGAPEDSGVVPARR